MRPVSYLIDVEMVRFTINAIFCPLFKILNQIFQNLLTYHFYWAGNFQRQSDRSKCAGHGGVWLAGRLKLL